MKNRTDEQTIQALLAIADSRFQTELRELAVSHSKLTPQWRLPDWAWKNLVSWPGEFLKEWKGQDLFPDFPFGSDFTPVEEKLVMALMRLEEATKSKRRVAAVFMTGLRREVTPHREALERMGLCSPTSWRDHLYRTLLLGVL